MATYTKILVALDLNEESNQVLQKANALKGDSASLELVHVIEPLGYAYGGDIPMDLSEVQEQLDQQAKSQLSELGQKNGIPEAQQHVSIGRPSSEIHRLAEETGADLIVVGSHGRHGIQLILGSTANAVLHGAKCDVLAVRVE